MERGARWSVVFLLGVALAGGGCIGPLQRYRSPGTQSAWDVADAYGTELRWGRLDEAAALVHPELRAGFQRLFAGTEDRLRITSFEVESVDVRETQLRAEAMVRYRFYRIPAVVEQSRREPLQLRWEALGGRWYVEPDLAALSRNLGLEPVSGTPWGEVP
jgi:hypothetical protein